MSGLNTKETSNRHLEALRVHSLRALDGLEMFIKECEENKATNEQWYLDFEDKLNKLSVKNHEEVR